MKTFARKITIRSTSSWDQRCSIIADEKKYSTPLGIILAMVQLKKIRDSKQRKDITFAAGLPDGGVPEAVKDELKKMSHMKTSPYLSYDLTSEYNIEKLSSKLADFHNKKFQTKFLANQVRFTAGSTPIIHIVASITQYKGSKASVISPSYPLYDLPVEMHGGLMDKEAKFIIKRNAHINSAFSKENDRWCIDYNSLKRTLNQNKPSLIYLNFPSNPTGYAPTLDEYKIIVKILLEHTQLCHNLGLRAPLILEDIAYATMMHDKKQFYGIHNAISNLYAEASEVEKKLLYELEQSLVVVHSFSKAFAVAGDRVGYFATLNENLFNEISSKMTVIDLTFGRGALAAATGAIKAGDVNHNDMQEYQQRLRHFEFELNSIINLWGKQNKICDHILKKLLPVQAKADAGFFSLTFFNFLKGQEVSIEIIDNLKHQISLLPETSKSEFSNIFENNKINNSLDAALWLTEKAGVIAVPINGSTDIMLRFSVGQTPISIINDGLKKIQDSIREIYPSVEAVHERATDQQDLDFIYTPYLEKQKVGSIAPIIIDEIALNLSPR